VCFVFRDRLVLAMSLNGGGGGSGPFFRHSLSAIMDCMDALTTRNLLDSADYQPAFLSSDQFATIATGPRRQPVNTETFRRR
jgi:hypothetical protein